MAATTQTMTEREMYLATFEREYQTTLRVLKAFPPAQGKLKFSERSHTANQIAWSLVTSQMVVEPILTVPRLDLNIPTGPDDFKTILAQFEKAHADITAKLKTMDDKLFNSTIVMPTGPNGATAPVRRADALWMMLSDTVHHRGQFSVYLRASGAKVPSIIGPSGDEPWM
jgi:uncharacterized damage-inducible protein DinB